MSLMGLRDVLEFILVQGCFVAGSCHFLELDLEESHVGLPLILIQIRDGARGVACAACYWRGAT